MSHLQLKLTLDELHKKEKARNDTSVVPTKAPLTSKLALKDFLTENTEMCNFHTWPRQCLGFYRRFERYISSHFLNGMRGVMAPMLDEYLEIWAFIKRMWGFNANPAFTLRESRFGYTTVRLSWLVQLHELDERAQGLTDLFWMNVCPSDIKYLLDFIWRIYHKNYIIFFKFI